MKLRKKMRGFALALSLFLLTGCGNALNAGKSVNLTEGKTPVTEKKNAVTKEERSAYLDFAVKVLRERKGKEKNAMLSPLSILYALGMTGNGASGETLKEMEALFGLSVPELNAFLEGYVRKGTKEEGIFKIANSIWFKDMEGFRPKEDFLKKNTEVYGAELFKAAFDRGTLSDINAWVDRKTDGMIKEVLKEIPEAARMYLINALAFEAEWERPYTADYEVGDEVFTNRKGKEKTVSMMRKREYGYLKDEVAEGFMKPYKGGKYAFIALLPKEGTELSDYLSSLDGKKLDALFQNISEEAVDTGIPQFESEYSEELSEMLKKMGMREAFDPEKADFSKMADGGESLFISKVVHKTYISVDALGTKAGAVTAVEMEATGAQVEQKVKKVILNRPFVYMIVDNENKLPIFIGTVLDIGK